MVDKIANISETVKDLIKKTADLKSAINFGQEKIVFKQFRKY